MVDAQEVQNGLKGAQQTTLTVAAVLGGLAALVGLGALAYEYSKSRQPVAQLQAKPCGTCPPPQEDLGFPGF